MNEDILQSTNFDLNHLSLGFENALPDHDYFNYTWDNLPPLLGPFDNYFQTESAGESANPEIKYPASLTQINQHTEQTNSAQPDFFHLMEIVGHSKELEHLLNTDKELEHLLTERIDANIENNNEIWSSILPEKTLLCNEYCENFLKESAEQLQLQSHLTPLEVLGVNLNLYSYETDAVQNNCTGPGYADSNADDDNTTPAGEASFYASYNEDLDDINQNNNSVRYLQQNDARQINESTDNKIYVLNVDFEKYPSENDNFHILGNERTMRNKRRRSLLHDKVIEANEICRPPVQQPVRIDPINKDDKSFSCTIEGCHKVYAKASHLKAHLRRHSGVKPFPCTWPDCKWRFSRSDELARHRRSHSGIKPYKCEMCDKCFSRSDHLAKHRKVHRRRLAQYGCAFTQSQCKKFAAKYKNEHYKTRL